MVDEVIQSQRCFPVPVPEHHAILTGLIDVADVADPYRQVIVKDLVKLRAIAKNRKKDKVNSLFQELGNILLSHAGYHTSMATNMRGFWTEM